MGVHANWRYWNYMSTMITPQTRNPTCKMVRAFCLYSVTATYTFDYVIKSIKEIVDDRGTDEIPMVLVGNKRDLMEKRKIPTEQGAQLAERFGCPFYETSARPNIDCDKPFYDIVRQMNCWRSKQQDATKRDSGKCMLL